MSTRDSQSFLLDVLGAIKSIEAFTAGRSYETYLADDMLRSAVERQLTIIGEAITKLKKSDAALCEKLLDSPQIIAFRNRLIHDYGRVDHLMVWGVVTAKLPLLRERVVALLGSSGGAVG